MTEEKEMILRQIKALCAHLRKSLSDLANNSGVVYERLYTFTLDNDFMLSSDEFALIERCLAVPEHWHFKDAASFSEKNLEMTWYTSVFGKCVPATITLFGIGAFKASKELKDHALTCLHKWLSSTDVPLDPSYTQLQKECVDTNEGNTVHIIHPIKVGEYFEIPYLWLLKDGTVMGELFNTKYCLVVGSINISSLCMAV